MSVGQLLKKSDGLPHWFTQSSSETDDSVLVQLMPVLVSLSTASRGPEGGACGLKPGCSTEDDESASVRARILAALSTAASMAAEMVAKTS